MYEIQQFNPSCPDEVISFNDFSADFISGNMALAWSSLIKESSDSDIELIFIKVLKTDEVIGVAILMLLKDLKIYTYLGHPLSRIIQQSTLLKSLFPKLAIGFLEIPISNYSGLLTRQKLTTDENQLIFTQISDYLHKTVKMHALCIKEDTITDKFINDGRFTALDFLPNTLLTIQHDSFEAYLKALSSKKRRRLLADKKRLTEAGSCVEICDYPSAISSELYALYKKTTDRKKQDDDYIQTPIVINEAFFANLSSYQDLNPHALIIRVNNKLIAYCLLMQNNETLYFKSVGLDYDKSYDTRAYFNLFYAAIEFAIEKGCKKIDFGMTSYCFKKRMSCKLFPCRYYVEFYPALLRYLRKIIVYLLGLKFGSLEI